MPLRGVRGVLVPFAVSVWMQSGAGGAVQAQMTAEVTPHSRAQWHKACHAETHTWETKYF